MRKLFIPVFILLMSCGQDRTHKTPFDWLEGMWEAKTEGGKAYEYWSRSGDAFVAVGGELVKNDTVFKEGISIQQINNKWLYIPLLEKQGPVNFTLTENTDTRFVFENKEHDFPQRIIYEKIDSGHFKATVEGEMDGKTQSDIYNFERLK